MRNRLIPRTEWFRFFTDFSHRHQGEAATVRVLDPRFGSQVEARDLPFEGIETVADGSGPIAIFLGSAPPRANVEHLVQEPKQVWLERSDAGAEEVLDIESVDGTKTLIQLSPVEREACTVSSCSVTR
jgi:Family of unknown function (DUF5335)